MENNKSKKPGPAQAGGGSSSSSSHTAPNHGPSKTKTPPQSSASTSASSKTNTAATKEATSGKNKKNQQQKRKKKESHPHSPSSNNAKKKQEAEEAAAIAAAEEEERKRQQEEEEKKETIAAAEHHIEQLHMIAASRQKQWKSMDPDNVNKIRSKAKSQMKSDVKKSLALVKRIGSMSTSLDKIQSLLKDIAAINLSRYSSEIAVALIDPRMRSVDVPVVAGIAGAMHQRYPGFLPTMLKHLFDSLKTCLSVMLSNSSSSSSSGNQTGSSSISTENSSILQQASDVLKQAKSRVEKIANKENDIDTLAADDLGMGLGDLGGMGMGSGASLSGSAKRSSSSAKENASGDGKSGEMSPKAAQSRCRVLLILLSELYLCGIWRDEQTLVDILNALVRDQEFNSVPSEGSNEEHQEDATNAQNMDGVEGVSGGKTDTSAEGSKGQYTTEKSISSVLMDAVENRRVNVDSVPKKSYRRAAVILPLVVPVLKHVSYGHLIDFDNYTNSGDIGGKSGANSGAIPLSQYLLGRFPQQYRSYLSQLPTDVLLKWPFVGCTSLQPYMQDLEVIYEGTAPDAARHLVFSCISSSSQDTLREAFFELFYRASAALQAEYSSVCNLEKKNREIEFNRGDVPEKASQNLSNSKQYFEKLSNAVSSLRDAVDCVAPSLKEPEPDVKSTEQGEITLWDGSWEGAVSLGPFDDEAMRSFYLDVPNLRDTIPSILLDTPEEAAAKAAERDQRSKQSNMASSAAPGAASAVSKSSEPSLAETAAKFKNPKGQRGTLDTALKQFVPGSKDSSTNQTVGSGVAQSSPKPAADTSDGRELHRPRSTTGGSDSSENEEAEEDNQEMLEEDFMQDDNVGEDEEVRGQLARTESLEDASFEDEAGWGSKESFDRLLQELSHCVSKDLIDNWAHEFVEQKHFNKLGRRLLLKHVAYVNPAATDMFPYYARLVAIFEKASPGFSRPLLATLEDDLKYMTRKKRNSHLDLKLRNGRLAAELCKFGTVPPNMIFRIMSRCIRDFSSHSIELLATILEGCGKYLYMLSQTRERVQQVLDTMQKLKKAKGLDGLRASLLDNAYYACVPVTGNNKPKSKERPMLYEFLRFLVLEKLGKISTSEIVKTIRRLPWSTEPRVTQWFRKAVFRSVQTSSATGSRLVSVLSSLKTFRESAVMHVLDHAMAIIEDGLLVSNMENFRYTQKRMAVCHFIGDAYNIKLVDNKMLLRLLYAVVNTGHALPRPSDAISAIRSFAAAEELRKKYGPNVKITPEDLQSVDVSSVFPHPLVEPDNRVPQIGTWGFHPLVPCESDKKEDVHRIHIVCEILQNCATPLSKGAARQKIDDFLCCFERYIMSKGRLPVETDTLISETLDLIRPDRKRFNSFADAQLACARLELAHCKELAEQAYNTRYKTQTNLTNMEEDEDLNEGESSDEEEEVEVEASAAQENASIAEEETEVSEHEFEDEELEREREPKHKSEADVEFESQLAELEKESIEQRKLAGSRVTAEHMTLPLHLKQKQNGNEPRPQKNPSEGKVAFTLLRRKGANRSGAQNVGTKVETRTLYVPENVPLAARSGDAQEARRREDEELKRVTLELQDRQEVEERKQTSTEVAHSTKKRTGYHRGEELDDVPEVDDEEAIEVEEDVESAPNSASTRNRGSRGNHHRGRGARGGRGRGRRGRV